MNLNNMTFERLDILSHELMCNPGPVLIKIYEVLKLFRTQIITMKLKQYVVSLNERLGTAGICRIYC